MGSRRQLRDLGWPKPTLWSRWPQTRRHSPILPAAGSARSCQPLREALARRYRSDLLVYLNQAVERLTHDQAGSHTNG